MGKLDQKNPQFKQEIESIKQNQRKRKEIKNESNLKNKMFSFSINSYKLVIWSYNLIIK